MVVNIFKNKNYKIRQVEIEWYDSLGKTTEFYPDAKKMRQDFLKKYA